jgi:hypothetical protein
MPWHTSTVGPPSTQGRYAHASFRFPLGMKNSSRASCRRSRWVTRSNRSRIIRPPLTAVSIHDRDRDFQRSILITDPNVSHHFNGEENCSASSCFRRGLSRMTCRVGARGCGDAKVVFQHPQANALIQTGGCNIAGAKYGSAATNTRPSCGRNQPK